MAFENLLVEDRGALRVITVNRPAALNALSRKVLDELGRAFEEADANAALRALAITGAGDKSFVAGADITEFSSLTPEEARAYSAKGHAVLDRLATLRMPVVAAVNGFALGGGLELALACDFIWASDNARLGLVAVVEAMARFGRVPQPDVRCHHLGRGECRAQAAAQPAERQVGHAGHRRERERRREPVRSDPHWRAVLIWLAQRTPPSAGRQMSSS